MFNKFEKIIKGLRKVHMGKSESEEMHDVLMKYTDNLPVERVQDSRAVESPYLWWRLVPVAMVLVIVIVGNIDGEGRIVSPTTSNPGVIDFSQNELFKDEDEFALGNSNKLSDFNKGKEKKSVSYDVARVEESIVSSTILPEYYPPTSDVTDTRDFLKASYSSRIETRDVSETVGEIDFIVREVGGRVDSIQSSRKYGQVSFVIPKRNFYEFRSRIEGITHSKLYTENTSSTNLLYQKQNIEQRMDSATSSLDKFKQDKKTLDRVHTGRVSSIRRDIANFQEQISVLNVQLLNTSPYDYATLDRLANEMALLEAQIIVLNNDLTNENRSYATKSNSLNSKISGTTRNIDNIKTEDLAFVNNVETVNGYIDVSWVNLWNLLGAFSPTPMWVNLSAIVLVLWWFWERKRYLLFDF